MFAAYDDQAIWGVGVTEELALQDAERSADLSSEEMGAFLEGLYVRPMTPALLALVEHRGGNVAFGLLKTEICGIRVLGTADEEELER
jgi:hypothetical protein